MKLPKQIKVAGVHYDIELVEDDEKCGSCSYDSLLLRVDPRLKAEKRQQVFIHELLHSIFYESGYIDHEEEMVDRVSRVLFQVLKDNDITSYLS
ncbi:MAG TPA: ImmA/IrrE family metallo-endopeptidase [Virgibacillus sp.]|nr:ImmA/IrrE family metallo-endopeptidase [Virgibacillus sp.]HLR69440.1 ImmA/IrrE family metallo-endopeptidase [Virgibacillus sp.]